MKYLKGFNEGWFGSKEISSEKSIEKKNIEILQSIYDLGLSHTEGPFEPVTWIRRGDLIPSENRNDEVITNFAGISLSGDTKTMEFELSLPVKFKGEFKSEIYQLLKNKFNILDKRDTGYTMVIRFQD